MKFRVGHDWRLGGLYSPPGAGTGAAVLMLHGFPGLLKNEDIAAELCRRGMTVFMPFYGGCWGSSGEFTVRGAFDDARGALRLLSRYHRVDAGRIGLLGYSFGGWAALRLASEIPVAAVAALAPAVPLGNEAANARYLRRNAKAVDIPSVGALWKEYTMECGRDRPEIYLPMIAPAPLLIVQGLKDRDVSPDAAAKLWDLAAQPKKLVALPDEEHEFENDRPAVISELCGWLEARLSYLSPPSRLASAAALR
ncbi:MAG: alpha/beta hydrolase family protein [Elusimicrobiota bacterium]